MIIELRWETKVLKVENSVCHLIAMVRMAKKIRSYVYMNGEFDYGD